MNIRTESLLEALNELLAKGKAHTQEELSDMLTQQGFVVGQSKISRLLRKLSAIKTKSESGDTVYQIPKEPAPPSTESSLLQLVLEITANETMIIVRTSPGSASLIARVLDFRPQASEVIGTLAGDDTIFVAPRSIQNIKQALEEVRRLLAIHTTK